MIVKHLPPSCSFRSSSLMYFKTAELAKLAGWALSSQSTLNIKINTIQNIILCWFVNVMNMHRNYLISNHLKWIGVCKSFWINWLDKIKNKPRWQSLCPPIKGKAIFYHFRIVACFRKLMPEQISVITIISFVKYCEFMKNV